LQHTDQEQDDRREPSRSLERRQQADGEGGKAHDRESHQESVLAPDQIADATKKQCAKWPHQETDREGCEICDICEGVVAGRIKLGAENGRETAEDIKVVPLEDRK